MPSLRVLRGALLGILLAGWSAAQQFPFQLRAASGNNVVSIGNGASITFNSSIGQSQSVIVTATYAGSGSVTVSQAPQIFGSVEFTATLSGKLPLMLQPGDSMSFTIQFKPTVATGASGQFNLPFTETLPPATGNTPTVISNAINLTLLGGAPSFVLSYILQADLNVVQLQPNGAILFHPTPINTTAQATLNITNTGSAPGQVASIAFTGAAFKLVGLPLFPFSIAAGATLQIGVQYLPTKAGSDTGQVQITFADGTNLTVGLQGSGTSPMFVYEVVQGDKSTPVLPGGTITLPDTNVGTTGSVVIRVKNAGNGAGTIGSINTAGQGFLISGGPLLPKTLQPNDSFTFSVTFTPVQSGSATSQLAIGADLFNLAGKGLGPQLVFSYVSGGATITLGTNGATSVVFSPVVISQSEQVMFTVQNSGTLATTISNIGIGESKSPYSLSGLPALPVSLGPGKSLSFSIIFAPITTGFSNGTLLVDTTSVGVIGSGTAPPPLPAYTFTGPSGNVAPQSQPSVGLQLSQSYPVAISGVLTLTTSGSLPSDPAVQFLTGGRTVPFTIPANGTVADFADQGSQILLQTGTVASTIKLTPFFATEAGGVDLTPASPATLQFTVPSSAPVLIAGVEATSSPAGVVLNFTGFATTRTLTTLNVQFTAAPGFSLTTTQVTVDLHEAALLWFQSTNSQGFGGEFTVSVPFNFSGTPPKGKTLLQGIASFSATVSNEVGASNSVQGPIQ